MDVVTQVSEHGREVVDAELARLARRSPELTTRQLAVIEAMLDDLADRLVVGRVRRLAARRPDLLPAAAALLAPGPSRLLR
ncbi:MAG TPA: hypothetical protein VI076_09585 [Actinopolymorphaceae bacterium]